VPQAFSGGNPERGKLALHGPQPVATRLKQQNVRYEGFKKKRKKL